MDPGGSAEADRRGPPPHDSSRLWRDRTGKKFFPLPVPRPNFVAMPGGYREEQACLAFGRSPVPVTMVDAPVPPPFVWLSHAVPQFSFRGPVVFSQSLAGIPSSSFPLNRPPSAGACGSPLTDGILFKIVSGPEEVKSTDSGVCCCFRCMSDRCFRSSPENGIPRVGKGPKRVLTCACPDTCRRSTEPARQSRRTGYTGGILAEPFRFPSGSPWWPRLHGRA